MVRLDKRTRKFKVKRHMSPQVSRGRSQVEKAISYEKGGMNQRATPRVQKVEHKAQDYSGVGNTHRSRA
jgi:hypothetical protein